LIGRTIVVIAFRGLLPPFKNLPHQLEHSRWRVLLFLGKNSSIKTHEASHPYRNV
jgi:hypothetical protein